MAILKDTFVTSTTYNSLPYIYEVSDVPKDQPNDLEDLRALLAKHICPRGVSIRLIHKHFNAKEGEVMTFKQLAVPSYGNIQVMQPMATPNASKLKGFHYFVDSDGCLQAYEYTASDQVTDLSNHQLFLDEFCSVIVERGLQRKFGLKLKLDQDEITCTEFEFPAQRSTIMIPEGLPIPGGAFDINVITEWHVNPGNKGAKNYTHACSHTSTSCTHNHASVHECSTEMVLGGQRVEPETPIWGLVHAVTEVW